MKNNNAPIVGQNYLKNEFIFNKYYMIFVSI